jgi:hypothetical protein
MEPRIRRAARMDEVTEEGRNVHNEKFRVLCWVIKSREMGLAGHVARGIYDKYVQIVFKTLKGH